MQAPRGLTRQAILTVVGGLVLMAPAAPAGATGSFTQGDLVVYEVGTAGGATPSSASAAVSLVEYKTTGVASGFSVALPIADSGSTHALTESGTATYDGELTQSADGTALLATGYDAIPATASITSSTVPRTVASVNYNGVVDTSTSLSDGTTEGQNFRSAASISGSTLYTGGGAGVGVVNDGGSSDTYLNSDKIHEVQIVNGNLYESTTSGIDQVGTGLPVSGTQSDTSLIGSPPSKFEPAEFALVTIGTGSTPNTMYVADTGNNAIEKYSFVSNAWTETGSVTVDQVTGLTASVSGNNVSIFATGAPSTSAAFDSLLVGITDSSGFDGSLTGSTVSTLVTAPTGVSFKGVAFSPSAPPALTPEVGAPILLPLSAVALGGIAFGVSRGRKRRLAAGVAI
jgi:hypothetical protein